MISDIAIDTLLNAIDAECRKQPYPPVGLPIHGEHNSRETFRQIVRQWIGANEPESAR